MTKKKEKRKIYIFTATVCMLIMILLAGTFAWKQVIQRGLNETVVDIPLGGGRIHDDFNGTNKDIYAENYTGRDENGNGLDAQTVLVRIRLDEYMEIGEDAGDGGDVLERNAEPLVSTATYNDVTTWRTRKPNDDENPFLKYWEWVCGGSTIYVPTFNKNSDSLAADINGTYEGKEDTDKHYDDYVEYTLGTIVKGNAYYDADMNVKDENPSMPGNGGEVNENYTVVEEEHEAVWTQNAKILTMDEWTEKGCPIGNYWVWDSDGWFYWAKPLFAGETTGLLLDKIQPKMYTTFNYYYAITVVGQFVTQDDLGTNEDEVTGFYVGGITPEGLELVHKLAETSLGEDGNTYVVFGHNLYQKVSEDGSISGLYSAGNDRVIGNSDDKDNILTFDNDVIINGINYGKYVLTPDSDTGAYRAMGDDDDLGTADDIKIWYAGENFPEGDSSYFSFTGLTVNIDKSSLPSDIDAKGTLDFSATVMLNEHQHLDQSVIWKVSGGKAGTKIDSDGVLTVASDETAGAELIVTAIADADTKATDTYTLLVNGPDTLIVSAEGNVAEIETGTTLQLNASVTKNGTAYADQEVIWSWSGAKQSGTKISSSGKLTVDANETSGQVLTIKAKSVNDNTVTGQYKVTVNDTLISEIKAISPGATKTVKIDNIEWYVVYKDDEKALMLSKNVLWRKSYSRLYYTSDIGIFLDGQLNSLKEVKNRAMPVTIKVCEYFDSFGKPSVFLFKEEKFFILSVADVGGYDGTTKDYTAGTTLSAPGGSWAADSTYWLRGSVTTGSNYRPVVNTSGSVESIQATNSKGNTVSTNGIRPAFFISLK